jgi:HSP20 family protein
MSALTHRHSGGPFLDLFDWLESPLTVLRPLAASSLRVEDYVKDGRYVLRAEIPGVDPQKDIDVSLSGGILTIRAEKHHEMEGKHHSEFRYGAFARSVPLPVGVDEPHIQAIYGHGVLEVTIPLKEKQDGQPQRRIPVLQNRHIDPN